MRFERKNPYSDFGLMVKHRLLDLNRSNQWLANEIATRGSCYMDTQYLLKILTGQEKATRKRELISQILSDEEARQEAENGKE